MKLSNKTIILGAVACAVIPCMFGCGKKEEVAKPIDYATHPEAAPTGSNGAKAGTGALPDLGVHPAPAGVTTGDMTGGRK